MKGSLLKYGILVSTAYAMICMWHWKIGFTFFTQLSNLYAAAVTACQLATGSRKLYPAKLTAAVSLLVTAAVFLFAVAPVMPGGIAAAYAQDHCASLCLHVITPVLTAADLILNDREYEWKRRHILYCLLPPVCWFLFILALGAAGLRWFGSMTAPYLFLNYGGPAGWFGFRPETFGPTSLGIGVFYVLPLILALFAGLGRLLVDRMRRQDKENKRITKG